MPVVSVAVAAERPPKIELGVGLGGQYLADYRGSEQMNVHAIPFPMVIYRGRVFEADRDGLRGKFIATDRLELNLSAEASLSSGTDENPLREGMPELDSAFELGPSLNINLTGESFDEGLALRLPLRAVYAVDTRQLQNIGYIANPRITWRKNLDDAWQLSASAGVLWGSEQYHRYYYSVDTAYVTPDRPHYRASSGFSGTSVKLGARLRRDQIWYGASLRYDNLQGAVFVDSPLVETRHYFAVSFAVGWFFWQGRD